MEALRKHPRTKLTDDQVQEIRDNPDGLTQHELAARYGVSQGHVSKIARKATRVHAAYGCERTLAHGSETPEDRYDNTLQDIRGRRAQFSRYQGRRHHNAKLTDHDVREMRNRHRFWGTERLAAHYGVSRRTVRDILEYRTWTHVPDVDESPERSPLASRGPAHVDPVEAQIAAAEARAEAYVRSLSLETV